MMGSYYYYDAEDVLQLRVHDCMWSGECYSSHTTLYTCNPAQQQNSSHPQYQHTQLALPPVAQMPPFMAPPQQPPSLISQLVPQNQQELLDSPPPTRRISSSDRSGSSSGSSSSSSSSSSVSSNGNNNSKKNASSRNQNRNYNNASTVSTSAGKKPSLDNKKLRHREVEKNRHRQLQAMVKTLSDQIPGKLDKETQVQTMKRAARYCIFLREIVDLLLSRHDLKRSSDFKERIENVYFKSCNRVDLIL